MELAGDEVQGIEAVVGTDGRVSRVNVYGPDAAMGMMLFEQGRFEATRLDMDTIAGKLFTESPIQDARLGKSIAYEVTFTAQIRR